MKTFNSIKWLDSKSQWHTWKSASLDYFLELQGSERPNLSNTYGTHVTGYNKAYKHTETRKKIKEL